MFHLNESLPVISKKEKMFVVLIIAAVLFLSLVPIFYGYRVAGKDLYFTGNGNISSADYSSYLSSIEQGRQGKIFFANLYTSEPQAASFFSPLWLATGLLGKFLSLSNPIVFHLVRVLIGAVFLLFFYYFISHLFTSPNSRLLALLLAGFSSGIGSFFLPEAGAQSSYINAWFFLPADFWISESNTFLSLYHSALFPLSQLLILAIFYLFLIKVKRQDLLILCFLTLLLGIIHPYDLLTIFFVSLIYLIIISILGNKIDWLKIKSFLAMALGALPAVLYYGFIIKTNPVVAGWLSQNIDLSPSIFSYLIGYGLVLVFALLGVCLIIKNKDEKFYFIIVWASVSSALLYAPIAWQRRLSNGLHLSLVILATIGIVYLWQKIKAKNFLPYLILPFFILGLFFSNLIVVYNNCLYYYLEKDLPTFFTQGFNRGLIWLKNNSSSNSIILSSAEVGNQIPAFTGRAVYIGHGHQTIDFDNKRYLVEGWFFRTNNDDEAKEVFLEKNNIDYVWYSSKEKMLGNFLPAEKKYLEKIYNQERVEIYKVKPKGSL